MVRRHWLSPDPRVEESVRDQNDPLQEVDRDVRLETVEVGYLRRRVEEVDGRLDREPPGHEDVRRAAEKGERERRETGADVPRVKASAEPPRDPRTPAPQGDPVVLRAPRRLRGVQREVGDVDEGVLREDEGVVRVDRGDPGGRREVPAADDGVTEQERGVGEDVGGVGGDDGGPVREEGLDVQPPPTPAVVRVSCVVPSVTRTELNCKDIKHVPRKNVKHVTLSRSFIIEKLTKP